ncbi:MAG: DPP IV N-terminal domain-containing protein, partial [Bacteroidota bacterium]|nr:DPP IV N-terminal domain-containing protein [Bacteroidota bacterium]
MKRPALFFFACFLFVQSSISQNKMLTMEDAILKQRGSLAPARLKQLMWIKGTSNYSMISRENDMDVLVTGNASGGTPKVFVTQAELNQALVAANFKSLDAFPAIQWKDATSFTFETEKKLISYNTSSKKILTESSRDLVDAENMDIAPKTGHVAYTTKNNLFVFDGKDKLIVSNDADSNIVNGKSVHRDEFGIFKGTFWSPNGTLLAFYRMDQTMVTDYPIIDWVSRPAKNASIKYPMAGDKSHEVTVGVYNVNNGKTVFLKTGEPKEQYLTNIAWSTDEQHIYMAVLNRDQNEMKLNSYNVATGYFEKTLF